MPEPLLYELMHGSTDLINLIAVLEKGIMHHHHQLHSIREAGQRIHGCSFKPEEWREFNLWYVLTSIHFVVLEFDRVGVYPCLFMLEAKIPAIRTCDRR